MRVEWSGAVKPEMCDIHPHHRFFLCPRGIHRQVVTAGRWRKLILMAKKIRCHCGGQSSCNLCHGSGKYDYDPGPRGYVPFRCPTCEGRRTLTDEDGTTYDCPTCTGQGAVDPAHPPPAGMWDVLTKIFFGA